MVLMGMVRLNNFSILSYSTDLEREMSWGGGKEYSAINMAEERKRGVLRTVMSDTLYS